MELSRRPLGGLASSVKTSATVLAPPALRTDVAPETLGRRLEALGLCADRPRALPFVEDATAGSESELQAAVVGPADAVDLPLEIRASSYYENFERRTAAGDTPKRVIGRLEAYFESNRENVWDNSWVRFPAARLSPYARRVFDSDLRADKSDPVSPLRADAERFFLHRRGEDWLRVPISYLLKLALADALGADGESPAALRATRVRLMSRFSSDNTSPETVSFHVTRASRREGRGLALAKETAKRYLFSQTLVAYANDAFGLRENGQRALLFSSPHPPVRQRRLNDSISDSFYRELFMNPCLSGWDRGEPKRDYMTLCHQTLSRSQLNAVGKLRDAGVITRNLVILPNTSNICLANNGAHVSLGSGRLAEIADAPGGAALEKEAGDLAIKIIEHFLPLFVGSYSAAPYRLDFEDFHPELALGFLPHQLDYTHLRMLWRRWKGKARNKIFGHPFGPLGPKPLDRLLATVFRLKGDFVPDFRLLDYLVAPMSTTRSPALDGRLGNEQRLLRDLDNLGVFDSRMSLYSLFRLRERARIGFSGFEGRHYSLFESFGEDMARAVNLQLLLSALAYRYIAAGAVTHADIPDRPMPESERRQIIFGAAIGIPTFFVDPKAGNRFLLDVVRRTAGGRSSRRYPGRVRVVIREYQLALLDKVAADAPDLVEAMGMEATLADLRRRIERPDGFSAAGKITRGALAIAGARGPFDLSGEEYNAAAERYYRGALRRKQMREALDFVDEDLARWTRTAESEHPEAASALWRLLGGKDAVAYLRRIREDLLDDALPLAEVRRFLGLLLVCEHVDAKLAA